MRSHPSRIVITAAVAAVVAGVGLASIPATWAQPAPAAPAAAPATEVPVKGVVLFSSGVGYFEHFGTVKGDGSAELRFKTAQINDVLKSLVVQDLDGGRAGEVSYASQEPVARTLKSFQVDITENPPLGELLNQLRGTMLTVTLPGAKKETGLVLGVEYRTRTVGEGAGAKTETKSYLNLKVGKRVRAIALEDAEEVQLEDPQLDAELDKALSALAGARGQDKKPVTIGFRGEGERRVRLGYVVEAPIWKTSYRLVLSDAAANAAEPGVGAVKGAAPAKANPDAPLAPGKGFLQGWAIVENQTDNDWDNVQLSLVSGRPISFIQDLYNPLYLPRPVVRPELYASLRPQTYEGGISAEQEARERAAAENSDFTDAPTFGLQSTTSRGGNGKGGGAGGGGAGLFGNAAGDNAPTPMDPTASVRSVASAGKIGELFQYTVGNVSIARQKSAMIPIVTEPLEAEKLSIYNAAVLEKHPLNGARVKNTTKNHLLQGPITVLDAGTYAGDARIDDLPPGQDRLISYGVDLDTQVIVESIDDPAQATGVIVSGKIVNGLLEVTLKHINGWQYVAQNKGAADKTMLIEHARDAAAVPPNRLVEPAKADELTEQVYRFSRPLKAGQTLKVPVRIEAVTLQQMQLTDATDETAVVYLKSGAIPQAVRDAIAKAVEFRAAQKKADDAAGTRRARVDDIRKEQASLRENMKAVAPGTDYYKRLATKLDEQETEVEKLQAEVKTLLEQGEKAREDLEAFVKGLNVG